MQNTKPIYGSFFLKFFESRFLLLSVELRNVVCGSVSIGSKNFAAVYAIGACICQSLSDATYYSLEQVASHLIERGLVASEDEQSEEVQQLIFSLLGIMSMPYTPTCSVEPGYLTINITLPTLNRHRVSDTWSTAKQALEGTNTTFVDILRDFGTNCGPLPI